MRKKTTPVNKKPQRGECKSYLYLCVVTVMFLSGQMARAQSDPVTIKQAINIALANNYGLRADSLNIIVTEFKNKELAGLYLPQVNYNSKFNYNIAIPSQMLPGTVAGQPSKEYVPIQFGTKYDASAGIEVSQNIYRKDLLLQIRSSGLNRDIAQTRYKLTREDMIYQVAGAFYALQSSAERIRTTASDYKNLKDVLTIVKVQFENGTLKRIDYESLQINVANKQSQLNQLQTQYKEQLEFFKYLLGIPAGIELTVNDSIGSLPVLKAPGKNEYLAREDIHLYSQLMQSKEIEVKSIKAENFPAVTSYLRYNYQSQFSRVGKVVDKDSWFKSSTVGVSVSIPIFDGNRRKNRINVAQTQFQQLKWQSEQQQQKAQTELLTASETLNNNREQYQVNAQNLVLAEKVFASRRALYTEGVTSLVELLDAERELSQARNLYIQSVIDVQRGMLDVHKANGTLLTQFIKAI